MSLWRWAQGISVMYVLISGDPKRSLAQTINRVFSLLAEAQLLRMNLFVMPLQSSIIYCEGIKIGVITQTRKTHLFVVDRIDLAALRVALEQFLGHVLATSEDVDAVETEEGFAPNGVEEWVELGVATIDSVCSRL